MLPSNCINQNRTQRMQLNLYNSQEKNTLKSQQYSSKQLRSLENVNFEQITSLTLQLATLKSSRGLGRVANL